MPSITSAKGKGNKVKRYIVLYCAIAYSCGYAGWQMRDLQNSVASVKEREVELVEIAQQRQVIINKTESVGEVVNGHVTAYLCKDSRERRFHGITKSGARCVPGRTAAVDPRYIPFGSVIYVPALGRYYIAEDTGNMIKRNAIDLAFKTRKEAVKFGRKNLTVVIIKQEA